MSRSSPLVHLRKLYFIIKSPDTARNRAVSGYNPNGSKLPMSYVQDARIGLGSTAATSHVRPALPRVSPCDRASQPSGRRRCGDALRLWEAGVLRASALKTRNDDEWTLRARIREAHVRRKGPRARPRVAKRPHRLIARARPHPAACRLHVGGNPHRRGA